MAADEAVALDGVPIVEINPERTAVSYVLDVKINGAAAEVLDDIWERTGCGGRVPDSIGSWDCPPPPDALKFGGGGVRARGSIDADIECRPSLSRTAGMTVVRIITSKP